MIADLECLSWQSYTTLDIVLTTVSRTGDNLTILSPIAQDLITSCFIDGLEIFLAQFIRQRIWIWTIRIELIADAIAHLIIVISLILRSRAKRVACGEVEDDNIIQLYIAKALYTAIVPMRPVKITLAFHHRKCMLCQRHGQWGLRNTRAIRYLRHEKIVTRKQRFLQRTRWNHIVLEEKLIDKVDCNQGENQCIDPGHHELYRSLGLFPPRPFDLLGNIDVKNERHDEQSPPALYPIEEEQVEYQHNDKLRPLHLRIEFFLFFLHYRNVFTFTEI